MDGGHPGSSEPPGPWRPGAAGGPVHAQVSLPGSKSMTNRALVLAALADGPSTVVNPLQARDTRLMAGALAALGAEISDTGGGWRVAPGEPAGDTSIDVGNAGTVMRFVPPVAALTSVAVRFHGDPQASRRPVGPLLAALRELGAVIDDGGTGAIPFTVRGTGSLPGGVVTLDASASSQLVSGLLLAAPRFGKGIEVRHRGPRAPSAPHIDLTVQMLRDAGAEVDAAAADGGGRGAPDTWRVHPGPIAAGEFAVQPDLVNSAPFLAAALVTGGSVTIRDWPAVTAQPAGLIIEVLTGMGASCELGPAGLTVTGTGTVRGLTADLADVSEVAPVVAALAALAATPSRLTGIGHMRRHETDRLAALATEISALGGAVTELADGLEITPRPLRSSGRPFASYEDHRMVMAAAVLALAVPGLAVAGAATVGKTFPEFPRLWAAMLENVP